jgi:hypothetical protein
MQKIGAKTVCNPLQRAFPDGNSISHIELKRRACMWTLVEFETLRLLSGDLAFVGIGQSGHQTPRKCRVEAAIRRGFAVGVDAGCCFI